jgi:hypothetical protein
MIARMYEPTENYNTNKIIKVFKADSHLKK